MWYSLNIYYAFACICIQLLYFAEELCSYVCTEETLLPYATRAQIKWLFTLINMQHAKMQLYLILFFLECLLLIFPYPINSAVINMQPYLHQLIRTILDSDQSSMSLHNEPLIYEMKKGKWSNAHMIMICYQGHPYMYCSYILKCKL